MDIVDSASTGKNGKYPKHVFLIILNEFCERFSFYGLKTVLYIFFTDFIGLEKNRATVIYHIYTCLCYFTPVFGAVIADGYIGLYKTIISLSIVYFIGELIVTLTSMVPLGAPSLVGPLIGLIIISIGTGGIKPCVGAFGGNQFDPSQTRYIETFFSVFYLSINVGSTIATVVTPIFRSDVKCFDNDCYPLAFGVPAAFMFVAIILFIAGTPFYKRDFKKGNGNIILKTIGCIYRALSNKIVLRKSGVIKEHWLDYASDKYEASLISDVKAFCKVSFVFLPLPVFWALYDQQGSRWTNQAQQLSGRIGSSFTLKPDQFQAVNPIFIVLLVPLFDAVVYPLFAKVNLLKKQLQRMAVGLVLAIVAFIIAAILESQMQSSSNALNLSNQIRVVNLSPCNLSITNAETSKEILNNVNKVDFLKNQYQNIEKDVLDDLFKDNKASVKFNVNYLCDNSPLRSASFDITNQDLPKTLIFYLSDATSELQLQNYAYNTTERIIGSSQLKFSSFSVNEKLMADVKGGAVKNKEFLVFDIVRNKELDFANNTKFDYAKFDFKVFDEAKKELLASNFLLETCGRYTVLLFNNPMADKLDFVLLTDVYPNGLHISWQLIQIFVMTIGEIMFSISGISFAFSQAPETMKSVLQGSWYFTIAIGNLIVVIAAEATLIKNQVWEYVFFAGLLGVATIIFTVMAFLYKYEDDKAPKEEKNELGRIKSNSVSPSENIKNIEVHLSEQNGNIDSNTEKV